MGNPANKRTNEQRELEKSVFKGVRFIPLKNKIPTETEWNEPSNATPEKSFRSIREAEGLGVLTGVRLGSGYLTVIDIDNASSPKTALKIKDQQHGSFIVQTNRGYHVYMLSNQPILGRRIGRSHRGETIEILCLTQNEKHFQAVLVERGHIRPIHLRTIKETVGPYEAFSALARATPIDVLSVVREFLGNDEILRPKKQPKDLPPPEIPKDPFLTDIILKKCKRVTHYRWRRVICYAVPRLKWLGYSPDECVRLMVGLMPDRDLRKTEREVRDVYRRYRPEPIRSRPRIPQSKIREAILSHLQEKQIYRKKLESRVSEHLGLPKRIVGRIVSQMIRDGELTYRICHDSGRRRHILRVARDGEYPPSRPMVRLYSFLKESDKIELNVNKIMEITGYRRSNAYRIVKIIKKRTIKAEKTWIRYPDVVVGVLRLRSYWQFRFRPVTTNKNEFIPRTPQLEKYIKAVAKIINKKDIACTTYLLLKGIIKKRLIQTLKLAFLGEREELERLLGLVAAEMNVRLRRNDRYTMDEAIAFLNDYRELVPPLKTLKIVRGVIRRHRLNRVVDEIRCALVDHGLEHPYYLRDDALTLYRTVVSAFSDVDESKHAFVKAFVSSGGTWESLLLILALARRATPRARYVPSKKGRGLTPVVKFLRPP